MHHADVAGRERSASGWGGARDGAGRKGFFVDRKRITIDIEMNEADELRKLASERGASLSQLARTAIVQFLKRARRAR